MAKKRAAAAASAPAKKVTAHHLALLTDFSERHIRDLEKAGVVKKTGRSNYLEVESLAAMVKHYANPQNKQTLQTVTLELRKEQALLAQRKREQLEGTLISAAQAEAAFSNYIVQINRLAEGIRAAAEVAARTQSRKKLPAWVLGVLDSVSLEIRQAGQAARIDDPDQDE